MLCLGLPDTEMGIIAVAGRILRRIGTDLPGRQVPEATAGAATILRCSTRQTSTTIPITNFGIRLPA